MKLLYVAQLKEARSPNKGKTGGPGEEHCTTALTTQVKREACFARQFPFPTSQLEFTFLLLKGRTIQCMLGWILFSLGPIIASSGMFVTFLCSKKVTRRKKSEQKLQLVLGVDLFCNYLATASGSCCFAVVCVCIHGCACALSILWYELLWQMLALCL